MAQADIAADISQQIGASRSNAGRVWYFIRRWPVIPMAILAVFILLAIFADLVAPHSERFTVSDNVRLPPAWYPPVVISALDLPKVVFREDGEQKQMGVGEAITAYGVDIPAEKLNSPSEVRAAFQDQTDLEKVRVLVVPIVEAVRPVGSEDNAPWEPVNVNVFDAAEQYGIEITVDQLIDPLYGGEVVKSSFEAYAGLEVQVTDTVAVPVRTGVAEAAKRYGVTIPEDQVGNQTYIEEAFAEQANVIAKVHIPTWNHVLGGDQIGRDLLSRVIHGARVTLTVSMIALVSGLLVGVAMGLVAGYFGGFIDEVIMRVTDIWLGIPFILLAIVVVIAVGQTFVILLMLLALTVWATFVRNVRGEVLTIKERDYVSLARVAGASTFRMIIWHILPGVVNTIIVLATLRVGQVILTESILSFLGAGIPPPTPAWGAMVSDGRLYINDAWWISFFPGLCIFLLVMSLNFFGDWLRDRLDPRLRQLD
jgi:peptide/nickel transport system permease protein